MYTAAEALRELKAKIVNKEHHTNCSYCNECLYREKNIMKMIDDQIFEIDHIADANKMVAIDQELEDAKKKYLGKWVKVKLRNLTFIVTKVSRSCGENTLRVHQEPFAVANVSNIELLKKAPF
jgi:hypothetical protein